MNSLDLRDIKEVYSRQPNDRVISGDKVRLPNKSDLEWCQITSFRYKGKLGKGVELTKEEDCFHLRSDESAEDRRCIEVESYPRQAEGKKPAVRLNEDMVRQLEPKVKESFERFLGEVIALGEGKTTSIWGIMKAISNAGYDIWVAGGAVRDFLQGKPAKDPDLAGTAPIGAFSEIVGEIIGQLGLRSGSNPDGTVLFIEDPLDPKEQKPRILEYAPLKLRFGYVHEGQRRWEYDHDLTQDAIWRDLTINCLFCDVFNGFVFDPTGCGWDDLQNLVLRVILPLPWDPEGEAAKKLLRLLKFTKRYPKADKSLARDFLKKHLEACERDFRRLNRHRRIRIVAQAFYGSKNLGNQDELREVCVELAIENMYYDLFKPLWE